MFAAMGVVLMLAIGAAIDIGRWLHARDQTVAAIDAALLAGGRSLQTNSQDTAGALALARKYYDQNVTKRLPVTNDTITFTVADNGMAMTASRQRLHQDAVPAARQHRQAAAAQHGREPVLQVRDRRRRQWRREPGGLHDARHHGLHGRPEDRRTSRIAAKDLINIVVWKDQSKYTSKVAIVPFSEDIRLPTTTALNKARGTSLARRAHPEDSVSRSRRTYYLSDCVVERTGSQKYTDAAPKSNQYVMAPLHRAATTGSRQCHQKASAPSRRAPRSCR